VCHGGNKSSFYVIFKTAAKINRVRSLSEGRERNERKFWRIYGEEVWVCEGVVSCRGWCSLFARESHGEKCVEKFTQKVLLWTRSLTMTI
jgi:hypothetical protein